MKIGAIFPHYEFSGNGQEILDYAVRAEKLGYRYLGGDDHVLGPNPDRPEGYDGWTKHDTDFQELFVLFSGMAAVTRTLEFCTCVLLLPQRQTVLAAKQAATLDYLSNGRLRLGIAVGWNRYEFEALGKNFHNRGKRIEEQIEIMRRLWTEDHVSFQGQWERIPDMGISPKPVQQPIPLWFGGHNEAVIRRAAAIGDGWMPLYPDPEKAAKGVALYDECLAEAGRSRPQVGLEMRVKYENGDRGKWRELTAAWKEFGATHVSFVTTEAGLRGPAEHNRALEQFREAVAWGD